jgi:predicted dehydrogenase
LAVKTRVGIIGLGGIAQLVHLPILSKLENVELAGVAEINKNRLKFINEKFQLKNYFTDYKEMLAKCELDAVVIATPTNTHEAIALDCIKAKKHVLIEKPVARTFKEAKEIYSAAIKNKTIAMVGMNLRFRPDAMLMKSLVNSGELGDLFYVKCKWLRHKSSEQKWFLDKSQSGGGVLIDLGVIMLDLALWMFDNAGPVNVSVQKFSHNTKNVEDSAVGIIKFESDKVILFEVGWGMHSEDNSFNLTAYGTKGTAQLNPFRAYKKLASASIDYTPAKNSNTSNMFKKSYENELKHFIAAIRQDERTVISSVQEAMDRMKLLEAIYKSAETKKETKV